MKPSYLNVQVDFSGARYSVDCRIFPARAPSHDGPDSPRYLDAGSPLRIEILRVRQGGTEPDLTPWQSAEIEAEVTRQIASRPAFRASSSRAPVISFVRRDGQQLLSLAFFAGGSNGCA